MYKTFMVLNGKEGIPLELNYHYKTPHFFYISDITNSPSFNGKIFRKKSTLENFRANVLKHAHSFDPCVSYLFTAVKRLGMRVI